MSTDKEHYVIFITISIFSLFYLAYRIYSLKKKFFFPHKFINLIQFSFRNVKETKCGYHFSKKHMPNFMVAMN